MTIRDQWFNPPISGSVKPGFTKLGAIQLGLTLLCAWTVAAAPPDNSAAVRLGQGILAYRSQNYPGTVSSLRGTQSQLPKLSDYISYHLAVAEDQTGDIDGAIRDLTAYRENPVPGSPFAGKISLQLAKSLLEKRQPAQTVQATHILENDYKILPQPDGDFVLAMAYEAQGEAPQAALVYQRVYYSYPNTQQAADAWTAMERLRVAIGPNFPKVPAKQQLERCERWLAAKEYFKARQEFETLSKSLPEPERDDAKVGVGAAMYLAGDTNGAFRYLKDLHVAKSESDAQRLYYLTEAARKNGDDSAMMASVNMLGQKYSKSVWRLKALVTAGNRYLVTNDRDKYAPLYKAASDTFSEDNSTAYCHWKFTWDAYLSNKADAATLLTEQVERYPADSRTSSALYFLGRLAENRGDGAAARAYYDRVSSQYPHYFYGVLARRRIVQGKLASVASAANIKEALDKVEWPAHKDLSAADPNPATKLRIDRARLLYAAKLPDLAESEIRYGSKVEGEQPQLLAVEMAQTADSPFRALRVMKSFSADYLSLPIENAPRKFWQMLFPLPFKDDLFRHAKAKNLDPYYVAALIRQESEFNPAALSPARAYGLMQLIPSTGRMVGRQEGVKIVSPTSLFNPALNIQLGTHYLRGQLDNWSGNWEQTLAAYNAGPGRVREWLNWGTYREPAEFVESIPFSETREYVQAVLRNADMYRLIYGPQTSTPELAPEQLASVSTSGTGVETDRDARADGTALAIPEYGAGTAQFLASKPVVKSSPGSPATKTPAVALASASALRKTTAVRHTVALRGSAAHRSAPASKKKVTTKTAASHRASKKKHA